MTLLFQCLPISVRDIQIIFSYLSANKPAYVEREILTPKLCIETIQKAGGVAVLAHPTLYYMDDAQTLASGENPSPTM